MIGATLSHYRVLEEISRGGMGIVYRGLDVKLDREVALKVLLPELVADPERKRRFIQEAQAAAKLEHPHIGVVHEIDEAEGVTFIAMELIRGEQLKDGLGRDRLPLARSLELATEVAEGLARAHDKGIVHRDLKPANIMVTEDGHAKVIDFGLAKLVEPLAAEEKGSEVETAVRAETDPGRVMGTVSYMSPEQARGKAVDHRRDIFSLGIVLYEMLAAQAPFKGSSSLEVLHALSTEAAPRLPELGSDATEEATSELQRMVDKCLAKDPNRRYQTIKDLVVDLRAVRDLLVSGSRAPVPSVPRRKSWWLPVGLAGLVALALITGYGILQRDPTPTEPETLVTELKRIAILPFENVGPPDEAYLADGITDEIRTRLSGLSGLAVIGRQSSIQYKDTQKTAQQIGEELGADFLLGGTISIRQTAGGVARVRVRPQLTQVTGATQQWAEVYDGEVTDAFQLETDIAAKVVEALDITLLEPERRMIGERPTENLEAYQYYLRGNDVYQRSGAVEDRRLAAQMFEKAIELDPDFAAAHARLSQAYAFLYWIFYDRTADRLQRARESVDKALQLAPELPEAHVALGYYYYHGHRDYERALAEFRVAQRHQPNNLELVHGIGYVQRRQGQFEAALNNLKKAAELDPRSANLMFEIGITYYLLRDYREAERYYERVNSFAPDWPEPFAWKAQLHVSWKGDMEKTRAILEDISLGVGKRDYFQYVLLQWILMDIFDEEYQEALNRIASFPWEAVDVIEWFVPKDQLYARVYGLMNRPDLERAHYDSARALVESRVEEEPEDSRFHSALGIAFAGLGRKVDALREGKRAVELLPVSKDAYHGPFRAIDLAKIYAMVGENEAAVNELEHLLSIPSPLSVPLLRLDPIWDPLRDHQRFRRLVSGEN